MFRKSVMVSALSLALLPTVADALGLGGIRSQSALNEPFFGQIELTGVGSDELDAVKIALAPDKEFTKAGVEWSYFLSKLKFQPRVSSSGQTVVLITSNEPIREPFLDFLIEVNWPKGRLIKEYTVLLDPPVTVRPATQQRPQVSRVPASVDTSVFPIRHGPVEPGSNLSRIAYRMAPAAGATVAQTAMALYRTNQQAFINGDINKLKAGRTLVIPTAAELFALDAGKADREFQAAIRGGKVTATPITDITAPQPEDRLAIAGVSDLGSWGGAPSEGRLPEASALQDTATGTSGQTTSAPPSGQGAAAPESGETEPDVAALQQDLLLTQEARASAKQENEELRGRISELEGQLADVQRLLELSNDRFAAIQQAESEKLAASEAEAPPSAAKTPQASEDVEPEMTPEGPAPEEAASQGAAEPRAVDEPRPARAEPKRDWISSFLDSIPQVSLPLVGSVALVLLILAWMFTRRRTRVEETFAPAELAPQYPVGGAAAADAGFTAEAPSVDSSAQRDATVLQDTSTYSELGYHGVETLEGDVLSEADVYIAYGRFREAQTLLEEAIEASPNRLDIKYKLAEAYHGAGNEQGLEALLDELQQAGSDRTNPDQWNRLNSMLEELKGAGAAAPGVSADIDSDKAPVWTGVEPESVSPPETGPTRQPDIGMRAEGPKGKPEAAYPGAEVSDLFSDELDLDLTDLEALGSNVASPVSEERPEARGAESGLDLQLGDLDNLRDRDMADVSGAEALLEPLSEESLSAVADDAQEDSLGISSLSFEVPDDDTPSSQWQKDSVMWDEVATKMDLARAYVEMEDAEAARIILEEVVQEGNESQRTEATEMMKRLG